MSHLSSSSPSSSSPSPPPASPPLPPPDISSLSASSEWRQTVSPEERHRLLHRLRSVHCDVLPSYESLLNVSSAIGESFVYSMSDSRMDYFKGNIDLSKIIEFFSHSPPPPPPRSVSENSKKRKENPHKSTPSQKDAKQSEHSDESEDSEDSENSSLSDPIDPIESLVALSAVAVADAMQRERENKTH